MLNRPFHFKIIAGIILVYAWALQAQNVYTQEGQNQYKKYHRDQFIKPLINGNYTGIDDDEGDAEDQYVKAAGFGVNGDVATAFKRAKKAVELGLPVERLFAGPRSWFSGLMQDSEFKAWAPDVELIHGPMLGNITANGAFVWAKTYTEVPVKVLIGLTEDLAGAVESEAVSTSEGRDFTAVVPVTGLNPGTEYFYKLIIDGTPDDRVFSFRTTYTAGTRRNFNIGFGGGSGYNPNRNFDSDPDLIVNNERMWTLLDSKKFSAFFLIGDFIYHDMNQKVDGQTYCYYRRHSQLEWRQFAGGTPLYGTWDDHDFASNDFKFSGSPLLADQPWKLENWKVFRNHWANPYYGSGEGGNQGVYYDFHINGVDFFFLDGRYHRFHEDLTMLGTEQKQWLFEKLSASTAVFKVIVSNVPVAEGAKASNDTWDGFPEERTEIFEYIENNKIDGVFFVSSDRHRSDHWIIGRPGSGASGDSNYDFQEFMSSRLTNTVSHGIIAGSEFGYNDENSYGELIFDMEAADPSVTYKIHNIQDEEVYAVPVKLSEMMRVPASIGTPVGVKHDAKPVVHKGSPMGVAVIAGDHTQYVRFENVKKLTGKGSRPVLTIHNTRGKVLQKHTLRKNGSRFIELKLDVASDRFAAGKYILKLKVGKDVYSQVFKLL